MMGVIMFLGVFATKYLGACGAPRPFLFPSLCFASERRAVNKKSLSFAMLRKRILLRSVAESNYLLFLNKRSNVVHIRFNFNHLKSNQLPLISN